LWAIVFAGVASFACAPPEPTENASAPDGSQAFIGATVFDGTGADVIPNAVIIVRDGRIEAIGSVDAVEIPAGAERIDVSGQTVVPGLINTHGHVSAIRGLEDGHYDEENILRQLGLYARYGVTTVASLGGDGPEAIAIRDAEDESLDRARIAVAGEVVTGTTVAEVHEQVDANAELGVDFIKIRVDDNLGTATKMTPELYQAAIERAHEHGLKLASHLFYLEDAKGLLEAGTDFLAHSIRDQEVDDAVIELMKENDVCYCPTLTREVSTFVYESVPEWFEDPFFLKDVDAAVLEELKDPERMQRVSESPAARGYKQALEVAIVNVKKVADGGATIAFGTDTGPAARFQGYFEHMELEMMADAGLTPEQVLMSATGDAASCLGFTDVGTLEPGNWADFIVLDDDPLADIRNLRSIDAVYIAGNRVPDDT
jgi:imidazolonepropionase-like amidohydrolase